MTSSNKSLDILQHNVRMGSRHVRTVMHWARRNGLKASDAIRRAGDSLGITHDLAWRLYHQQKIWTLPTERLRAIQVKYIAAIDREIEEMEKRTEELRVEKALIEATLVRGNVCYYDPSITRCSNIANDAGNQRGAVAI